MNEIRRIESYFEAILNSRCLNVIDISSKSRYFDALVQRCGFVDTQGYNNIINSRVNLEQHYVCFTSYVLPYSCFRQEPIYRRRREHDIRYVICLPPRFKTRTRSLTLKVSWIRLKESDIQILLLLKEVLCKTRNARQTLVKLIVTIIGGVFWLSRMCQMAGCEHHDGLFGNALFI